jgi:GT2 family glycosyltransferase
VQPFTSPWPGLSIVIPTWNGLALLTEFMPSVYAALSNYPGPWECLIVDDGGSDETAQQSPVLFPWARCLRREQNGGFSAAANSGFAGASHDLVLLLNNDISVESDFLLPLVKHFQPEPGGSFLTLFAAVSLQINPTGGDESNPPFDGCRGLCFVRGELRLTCQTKGSDRGGPPRPSALANGGCTLFSRAKVAEIGGFCPLFNPFYFEDAELSVQALRRGWRITFEPRSIVHHRPNSTTVRRSSKSATIVRNEFFFQWLLLDTAKFWAVHLACVAPRLMSRTLQRRFEYARGLWLAFRRWPQVKAQRRARTLSCIKSLRDVLLPT